MKPYFPPCNERKSYWQENKYLTANYLCKPQKRFNTLLEKLERARSLGGRQIQRRTLEASYIFAEKKRRCARKANISCQALPRKA